jgi:hypothetical protein
VARADFGLGTQRITPARLTIQPTYPAFGPDSFLVRLEPSTFVDGRTYFAGTPTNPEIRIQENEMQEQFTPQQIANYRAFTKVRDGGKYNMFSADAHRAARLTTPEALFVMANYDALSKAAQEEKN